MNTNKKFNPESVKQTLVLLKECANCWGYQEWAGLSKDGSFNPPKRSDGFIMKFVKRYLSR